MTTHKHIFFLCLYSVFSLVSLSLSKSFITNHKTFNLAISSLTQNTHTHNLPLTLPLSFNHACLYIYLTLLFSLLKPTLSNSHFPSQNLFPLSPTLCLICCLLVTPFPQPLHLPTTHHHHHQIGRYG